MNNDIEELLLEKGFKYNDKTGIFTKEYDKFTVEIIVDGEVFIPKLLFKYTLRLVHSTKLDYFEQMNEFFEELDKDLGKKNIFM